MSQRITIDPVTRIEGHLRIDCEIENGVVSKAWASGTMWRGMEEIVKKPRSARCMDDCATYLWRMYYHSRAVFRSCGRKCAEYRRSG
ncbi:hydrogenase-2 large subunit [Escherichia coli]|uniref:Hydrogenase-2 large subunit n=1 Tax=Escherichia coli TaxID=562 RepID=A0A447XRQ8_ECOLX|nr:hydrogenase-2 large subunit [Escherichia coli]